jgi:hypothetical protein
VIDIFFQSHFLSKHKTQSDNDIKPKHRVGQGPIHVAPDPVDVAESQEEPSDEAGYVTDDQYPDDQSEDGSLPEQTSEELFSSENYTFLK